VASWLIAPEPPLFTIHHFPGCMFGARGRCGIPSLGGVGVHISGHDWRRKIAAAKCSRDRGHRGQCSHLAAVAAVIPAQVRGRPTAPPRRRAGKPDGSHYPYNDTVNISSLHLAYGGSLLLRALLHTGSVVARERARQATARSTQSSESDLLPPPFPLALHPCPP